MNVLLQQDRPGYTHILCTYTIGLGYTQSMPEIETITFADPVAVISLHPEVANSDDINIVYTSSM